MKSKSESVSPKKKAASARNKSVTVDYWNLAWTHTFSLLFFAARELDRLAECLRRRDDCENNTWKRKVTTRTYRPSQPALRSSSCQWSQTFSPHICWTRGSWQSSLHNVRALVGESSLPDYTDINERAQKRKRKPTHTIWFMKQGRKMRRVSPGQGRKEGRESRDTFEQSLWYYITEWRSARTLLWGT